MVDVTIIGGGPRARDCGEVLSRSGFNLAHTFEVESTSRSPIILGEIHGAFQLAREAMETGRHLLIAATDLLTPERLSLLLERRRTAQGLFIWSDRRNHPGYRFVTGLMESDTTWRPRYLRQEMLSTEPSNSALFRWHTLESIALINSITAGEPRTVCASAVNNAKRNAPDMVSMVLAYKDVEAHLIVGLGEPLDRKETLVASATRKAYVDELNQVMPVRIIDDEPLNQNSARWLSCSAPSSQELARQQCIAFLDATLHAQHAIDEATIWQASLSTLASMEQSLTSHVPTEVVIPREDSKFRIIAGLQPTPPSVA